MNKLNISLCLAVVALAAAVAPATASAAALLRETPSTDIAVGTKVTFTGDQTAVFTAGLTTVECNENWMTGSVVKNNATEWETTIETLRFASNLTMNETRCKSSGFPTFGATLTTVPALTNGELSTSHWCIKNVKGSDKFELIGNDCGQANGTFTVIFEGTSMKCIYSLAGNISGSFTTDSHPATFEVTGKPAFGLEAGSGMMCPAKAEVTTLKYELFTDTKNEEPLFLTAKP